MSSNRQNSRMERRQQQQKKRVHRHTWGPWKKILLSVLALIALGVIACGIMLAVMIHRAPSLEASDLESPLSTRIYDQDGELVSTVFDQENRVKVQIDEVPEMVQDAVISIEDKRFRDHHGIDFRRLGGAVVSNIKNGWGAEGGSTITQQVIKRTVLTSEKTLTRKVQEAWLALQLERKYSKDEILEMYLNNVYFGHGAYGIKTASIVYFGEKDLSELNASQAALLAGMPNLPSADDPFKHPERAKNRRDLVLSEMADHHVISKQQADEAKGKQISEILREKEQKQESNDPYAAYIDTVYQQLVKQEKVVTEKEFYQDGLEIYTFLDSKAQQKVYDLLQSDEIPYPDENFETGLTLVDTKTGAVQAVGGGRQFEAIGYTNYGSTVTNQPGSTIKPILDYGPAIEHLNWSTSHTLSDERYQYSDGTPINEWDNEYWGDVSMRRALEWSRNIPALKAFQAVGPEKAQKFAAGLGIHIDPIFEAASIGGFDGVAPMQMAAAYAAFGNGGTYNEPNTVKKIVYPDGKVWEPEQKSEKAMHDYTAYMITDMLKTVVASGTGTQANVDGIPVAGKTGSTNIPQEIKDQYGLGNGVKDSWFSGYTTEYSLAVWTGYPSMKNKDGEIQYIRYDGSENIAKQLFRQLMSEISDPNTPDFKKPDSVIANGSELYVKGMEPKHQQPVQEKSTEPDNSEQEQKEEPEKEEKQDEDEADEENEKDEEESDTSEEEQEKPDEEPVEEEEQEEKDAEEPDTSEQEQDKQDENQQQEDKDKDKDKDKETGSDQNDKKQDNQKPEEKDPPQNDEQGRENQGSGGKEQQDKQNNKDNGQQKEEKKQNDSDSGGGD